MNSRSLKENTVSNRLESLQRGSYDFSFFKMRVNVFASLAKLSELEPVPKSTFFHEYLHFLQDITTTFGLTLSCIEVDKMKYGNNYILGRSEQEFKVPISFADNPAVHLNNALQELYMGVPSPDLFRLVVEKVEKQQTKVWLPAPYNKNAPAVYVYFRDAHGNLRTFPFGGLHIAENMCHIAQTRFNPKIKHNDVPYRTAELVAQFIYPPIGQEQLFVFALCEACLMHIHPGDLFYEMLQEMKRVKFEPATELEIYDFVLDNVKIEGGKTLLDIYSEQVQFAMFQLAGYFTTENYENEIFWLFHVLQEAEKLRKENMALLLGLLNDDEIFGPTFKRMIFHLGTPLMQNLDDDAWFFSPYELKERPIQADRFAVLHEIYMLWVYGKKECSLKRFCSANMIGGTTDARCDEAPWSRVVDTNLCGYAQFWKTWKLKDKKPVFD